MDGSPDEPFNLRVSSFSEDKNTPMAYNTDRFWRPRPQDQNPWARFKVKVTGDVYMISFVLKSLYAKGIIYQLLSDDRKVVLYEGVSDYTNRTLRTTGYH